MIAGWRGVPGPYTAGGTGNGSGGGLAYGQLGSAAPLGILPGSAGGGGHVPGDEAVLSGYGGCGGPGPGALYGI